MTQNSDDWSDLSQAWIDPARDEAETNRADAAFVRSLRRRDLLARINYGLELLGGVAVVGVVTWVALRTPLPWPVLAAAYGFVVLGVGLTVWSRRGDPGVLTGTPEEVLRSAVAQARTGERWAGAGLVISLAASAFLFLMSRFDPSGPETRGLYPAFSVFLLLCIGGYVIHARRCRQRRRAHEAMLSDLIADESAATG